MGVYIRGMEMPTSCANCELANHFDGYNENECPFNAFSYYDCPLAPVPPHGRLNVIEPYMQHDEDDGFDELIKPSDIDYMHTPSVEGIIEGNGFDSFIKHFED